MLFAVRVAVEFVVVSSEMIHIVRIVVAGDVERFVWVQMKRSYTPTNVEKLVVNSLQHKVFLRRGW